MALRTKVYTLSLNPTFDKTFYLNKIIFEDINRVGFSRTDPGGKGINVARIVHNLGGQTLALALVGGEIGSALVKLISLKRLPARFIKIKGETRLIVNIFELTGKKVLRINEPGPGISAAEFKSLINYLRKIKFAGNDFLVLSGSLPPGLPDDTYFEIMDSLSGKNLRMALDVDGPGLKEGLKGKPFLIKPNLWELERLTGCKITHTRKLKEICDNLRRLGIKTVLVTLGEKGAFGFGAENYYYAASPRVAVKSSIGCGDAFLGGYLVGLGQGKKEIDCLKLAVACGAAKAAEPGTRMPSRKTVYKILPRIKILPFSLKKLPV